MSSKTLLMISGSLRLGSTNTAAINTAARLTPVGWTTEVYRGMNELPHFNPDDDDESVTVVDGVVRLRSAIGTSAAILICTPEYAGALPGSFKNLLDWTVGGMEIVGKPVAWLNVSAHATHAADAHESLRKVLGFTGADIVDAACVDIPVARADIGGDVLVTADAFEVAATESLRVLTDYAAAVTAD
ncbi:NADPH-dependent FMN reductase [Rhodococcoides yunnanense]|uniref:NADPH-dependent FMN reductase n=1 Tax=Rhodococcoides yunnanense TaxID=278209 RepID=UPI000933C9F4|nr:NADPH-dependent FMN reductase [Rhodococcus yunnanensis]